MMAHGRGLRPCGVEVYMKMQHDAEPRSQDGGQFHFINAILRNGSHLVCDR
jgi:hypothetical protein